MVSGLRSNASCGNCLERPSSMGEGTSTTPLSSAATTDISSPLASARVDVYVTLWSACVNSQVSVDPGAP